MTPDSSRPDAGTSAPRDPARYQRDGLLATGGMGEVWRARDTVLDREVALKLLKPEYSDDPGFRERFATEARNAAALLHPGIAATFDYGELDEGDRSRPFLVMELVDGRPLSQVLHDEGALEPARARDIVAQAAEALAVAHQAGLVHRDVKPANLMVVDGPGGTSTVKVTDFGIARAVDAVPMTQTGQILGTPHYLSPEQADGASATSASDVYALGVVLFECLTARRPFAGDTPVTTALAHLRQPVPDLPSTVPADLAAITRRALSKDPRQRYADGGELARALRGEPVPVPVATVPAADEPTRVLAGVVPVPAAAAGPPTPAEPAEPTRRRGVLPAWWPLGAVAALALLVGVALLVTRGQDPSGNTDTPGPGAATSSATSSPSASPAAQRSSASPSTTRAPHRTTKKAPAVKHHRTTRAKSATKHSKPAGTHAKPGKHGKGKGHR